MLKYINYQILDNADQQAALEKKVSVTIARNIRQNIDAFRLHIPSLVNLINDHAIQQYSLFCTKDAELNIVDFATGRVFYQSLAQQEVMAEVQDYYSHAAYFNLKEPQDDRCWRHQALPQQVDALLVFGLGLGYHLNELLMDFRSHLLGKLGLIRILSAKWIKETLVFACSDQSAFNPQLFHRASESKTVHDHAN